MIAADAITLREEELATILESPVAVPAEVPQTVDPSLSSFMGSPVIRPFPTAGGEADLYLIQRNGAPQVLKLYRFGIAPREDLMQRVRELGRVYPHCFVPVLEFGYDPATRRWFELLEYIAGGSLKERMDAGAGAELLPALLPQLAVILTTLHDNRVLHLDLKPSNILVRSTEPLQVVLADFGISSILDPELSRKLTTVKGTPHYWSPESFTGVVGAEADWWSLGMILLELLQGRHPFSGMDPKLIMFTLSTKGVELDSTLPEPYRTLLTGLLTRRPGMRWGREQVSRFLSGEAEIPTFYDREIDEGMAAAKPFRFLGREYAELGELLAAALTGEEGWNGLRVALEQEHLERWLGENGNQDIIMLVRKLRQDTGEDTDLALVRLIYQCRPDLPFVLYGKQISLNNLLLFTRNTVRKQGSLAERTLLDDLMKGRLAVYYGEFLFLTGRAPDPLFSTLTALGRLGSSSRFFYGISMDPGDLLKLLDLLVQPEAWFLPALIADNPQQEVEFLVSNHELLLTREELQAFLTRYQAPAELEEALQAVNRMGIEHFRKCCTLLHRLRSDQLLPERGQLADLMRQRLLPPELTDALLGRRYAAAVDAWKTVREWQKQKLLLAEQETAEWLGQYGRERAVELQGRILINAGSKEPLDREQYRELAADIKCRLIPPLLPMLLRVHKSLQTQALPESSFTPCRDIAGYVAALASRTVCWDEPDRRAIKALHELLFVKKVTAPELLGQVPPPRPDTWWHPALEMLLGYRIYDNGPVLDWIQRGALTGIIIGLCFALTLLGIGERMPALVMMMALAVALLRRSWKLGIPLLAITWAFLMYDERVENEFRGVGHIVYRTPVENVSETALTIILMAWIGVLVGALIGTKMGEKFENLTDGERFLADYRARVDTVLGREYAPEEPA